MTEKKNVKGCTGRQVQPVRVDNYEWEKEGRQLGRGNLPEVKVKHIDETMLYISKLTVLEMTDIIILLAMIPQICSIV